MKINYYAILDKKTDLFSQLFPATTHGAAERSFNESVNNHDSQHHKYPDDFVLYHITEFDDETAQFTLSDPLKLVEATQLKK